MWPQVTRKDSSRKQTTHYTAGWVGNGAPDTCSWSLPGGKRGKGRESAKGTKDSLSSAAVRARLKLLNAGRSFAEGYFS